MVRFRMSLLLVGTQITDTHHNGKLKYCISCSNLATVEALFSVGDGVTVVEKYCDVCGKKVR